MCVSVNPALGSEHHWPLNAAEDWVRHVTSTNELVFRDGGVTWQDTAATVTSSLKSFSLPRQPVGITVTQSVLWHNWSALDRFGPGNLGDAPVLLRRGEEDYWMFGRYRKPSAHGDPFEPRPVRLDGFDLPLQSTPDPLQFDAPGGRQPGLGGYHAWQSRDLVHWVHHGPVSDQESKWMTSAEQVGDKTYFYYDFPNDQDPHLILDEDLTDGQVGRKMGVAFKDPSDGSDAAVIRDLQGRFHLILENWSPVNASKRSWDSPLASHAVSPDGIRGFELKEPVVDYRTHATGQFGEYPHPHWHKEDPENFPGRLAEEEVWEHRIAKGTRVAFARYEVHKPEQVAYGDWAAIAVGDRYYLFGDYDPPGKHGRKYMKIAWLTASSIDGPFTHCGTIGQGHPDPDIMFAKGRFYLASQAGDFVSPGPWVDGIDVRIGVDQDNDQVVDFWAEWAPVREQYVAVEGFAKQVAKTPARRSLESLPSGYGFQVEIRMRERDGNVCLPVLTGLHLEFAE